MCSNFFQGVPEVATAPKRYRLKDRDHKHVKPKPPRAATAGPRGAKPKWEGDDRPARAPRSRAAGDDRPPPRKRYDSDDRPPPRGPRKEYGDSPRAPRREFDGPPRGPRRTGDAPPRGRSFGGPKKEWSDRPPRREFGDRAPRAAGGGAEVMEALARIEASLKDLTKRMTLIENQLDEIFGEE